MEVLMKSRLCSIKFTQSSTRSVQKHWRTNCLATRELWHHSAKEFWMTEERILCTSEGKMRVIRTPLLQLLAKKSVTRCDSLRHKQME